MSLVILVYPHLLSNHDMLTDSFHDRFEQQGVQYEMSLSSVRHRSSISLTILLEPHLNDILISFHVRSNCLDRGILFGIDKAIELHRAALELRPPGHHLRAFPLSNLALSLHDRFKQQGVVSDLEEAIELHLTALELRLPGHSDQSSFLSAGQSDLDEAIEHHRAALALYPPVHSHQYTFLNNLASSLDDGFMPHASLSPDLDEASRLYFQLFRVSRAVSRGDPHQDSSINNAAALSSSSHHVDVVKEAISSLQWMLSRAVFVMALSRLLWSCEQLSFRLCNAFDKSTGDQSRHIRQLTRQWDDVVSRIRMLPDFSRFLFPPLFSDLQKAAEYGPGI
ncbi:hypothetical protein EDB19DRAFT_2043885 [Suillus lakei]|nr:hypothetical protein EDB19DRAFT_2043885 [Suillus lakei]